MNLGEVLAAIGRPIAFYPSIAKSLKGLAPGVLFCQLAYWHGKQRDQDGWIRKSWAELEAETGLSRREQQGARAMLRGLGLIEERLRGVPATTEYRLNLDALDALFPSIPVAPSGATRCTERDNQLHPAVQLDAPHGATRCTERDNYSIEYSETTPETTPEKKKETARKARCPALPLPDPWPLTDTRRQYAIARGCLDPERNHEQFVNHFAGTGGAKADWEATYRNWTLGAHGGPDWKACGCRPSKRAGKVTTMDAAQNLARRWQAEGKL